MDAEIKHRAMTRAIELAMQGKGHTAPNPCVGAVVVRDDQILASGWHTRCGNPHAEVEAIADAHAQGIDLSTCTLFVTLEPCNHTGKTPPCTRAILRENIPHVVIGTLDPNAHVEGGGAVFLRSQGVEVEIGVMEQECLDLIADFILWQQNGRPYSYLKLATTLDGKIATRTGHSAWVSGETARNQVHDLRSRVGAIIVGGETFRADDPSLTCRMPGFHGTQPWAILVTSRLPEDPKQFQLLRDRPEQTMFWTSHQATDSSAALRLKDLGCHILPLPPSKTGLDLASGFEYLRRHFSIYATLCEGGGRLAMSLVDQGLADEILFFQTMKILGDAQGKSCFSGRSIASMHDAVPFRLGQATRCGEDLFIRLWPKQRPGKQQTGNRPLNTAPSENA